MHDFSIYSIVYAVWLFEIFIFAREEKKAHSTHRPLSVQWIWIESDELIIGTRTSPYRPHEPIWSVVTSVPYVVHAQRETYHLSCTLIDQLSAIGSQFVESMIPTRWGAQWHAVSANDDNENENENETKQNYYHTHTHTLDKLNGKTALEYWRGERDATTQCKLHYVADLSNDAIK